MKLIRQNKIPWPVNQHYLGLQDKLLYIMVLEHMGVEDKESADYEIPVLISHTDIATNYRQLRTHIRNLPLVTQTHIKTIILYYKELVPFTQVKC